MSEIFIRVLGPVESVVNGQSISPPGRKLCCILGTLALRAGDDVRRDELIEELDLARTTGKAVNALHAHIARLRRWLDPQTDPGDTILRSTSVGYSLDVSRNHIDIHAFTDLLEHASQLAPHAPSVVSSILEEALSMWRAGEAFQDVLDGSLLAAASNELQHMRRSAREMLIDAWSAMGQNAKILMHAPRFIADDPLNELLHVQHIIALRRSRREIEAIEAYRAISQTLMRELAIQTSSSLDHALKAPLDQIAPPAGSRSYAHPRPRTSARGL